MAWSCEEGARQRDSLSAAFGSSCCGRLTLSIVGSGGSCKGTWAQSTVPAARSRHPPWGEMVAQKLSAVCLLGGLSLLLLWLLKVPSACNLLLLVVVVFMPGGRIPQPKLLHPGGGDRLPAKPGLAFGVQGTSPSSSRQRSSNKKHRAASFLPKEDTEEPAARQQAGSSTGTFARGRSCQSGSDSSPFLPSPGRSHVEEDAWHLPPPPDAAGAGLSHAPKDLPNPQQRRAGRARPWAVAAPPTCRERTRGACGVFPGHRQHRRLQRADAKQPRGERSPAAKQPATRSVFTSTTDLRRAGHRRPSPSPTPTGPLPPWAQPPPQDALARLRRAALQTLPLVDYKGVGQGRAVQWLQRWWRGLRSRGDSSVWRKRGPVPAAESLAPAGTAAAEQQHQLCPCQAPIHALFNAMVMEA
ncbi:uncharacterized protein LOC135327764 isoform X2 [Dromaius novaehollandiae]|uniref:uncharacterized protein LOC135327764 isoform X2 n=1 Tax=Dromaius novaehollandiae TaxID=8790 RepID=UPI00311D391A